MWALREVVACSFKPCPSKVREKSLRDETAPPSQDWNLWGKYRAWLRESPTLSGGGCFREWRFKGMGAS